MALNLVKLSVGSKHVDDLAGWRDRCLAERKSQKLSAHMWHTTRMWPRREAELLEGGSIYWVISGFISARQHIRALEEVIGEDGIRRCKILIDPEIIHTELMPRRPFQGWRYLKQADAPKDLRQGRAEIDRTLAIDLSELGLL